MTGYPGENLAADPPFQPLSLLEDKSGVLRGAYCCFPSGVVAVSALIGGKPVCMIASSFVAVSIEPALVAFCVQWTSQTWAALKDVRVPGAAKSSSSAPPVALKPTSLSG